MLAFGYATVTGLWMRMRSIGTRDAEHEAHAYGACDGF
jgi:hypothetical protein